MHRLWLAAGALAMAMTAVEAGAADRLQYGTAWAPGLALSFADLPSSAEADGDEASRVVRYTPRAGGPSLFASYTDAAADPLTSGDVDAWSLGLSYEGFGIGGSFLRTSNVAGIAGRQRDAYALSGNYRSGRWTFGLSYERFVEQSDQSLGFARLETDQGDRYSLGVTYEIGPGVTLGGGLRLDDYQAGTGDGGGLPHTEGPRTILLFGTAIEF